jgi:hypothetical protein
MKIALLAPPESSVAKSKKTWAVLLASLLCDYRWEHADNIRPNHLFPRVMGFRKHL